MRTVVRTPWFGRAAVVGSAVALVAAAVVGLQLSGHAFGHPVPWRAAAQRAIDSEALSFATRELRTSAAGGGRVVTSGEGPHYREGEQVTVTAEPEPGVEFLGWEGDLEGHTNPAMVTLDADKHVTARFAVDTTPPAVTDVGVSAGEATALVTWTTDEPATSRVAVRTDAGAQVGTFGPEALTRQHAVTVTGLSPGAAYRYSASSTNLAGLTASTPEAGVATPAAAGPAIQVWGGPHLATGVHGDPQARFNVLGNANDPDGVASLSYSLDGGPARPLSAGPDQRRLQAPGDFNADIPVADLRPGDNQVVITALDGAGRASTATVAVERRTAASPLPYTTDWRAAARLDDQAQAVDGRWSLDGTTARPVELGYDRVLALGDVRWHDYEVTVPVTVHGLGPGHGADVSGRALVGLGLHWNGHTQVRDEQPGYYWYPTGALAWYRWYDSPRFELRGNEDQPIVRHQRSALAFGRPYVFKARARTVNGGVEYSWKVWPQGTPEPVAWDLTLVEDAGPATGAVALIAHHVDVQFGDVSITPLE